MLSAVSAENPDRVRRLALDMRLRAAELELAGGATDEDLSRAIRLFNDGAGVSPAQVP